MRVYIETYGCALNHGDTYIMKTVLVERGHSIVNDIDRADVIIVNTCTVRYDTQQKMIKRIRELYKLLTLKEKKLIIAGCMAKAQPYLLNKIASEASLVSPQNSSKIWIAVEHPGRIILLDGDRERNYTGRWIENKIAIIPIQEGCLGNCSFCIVKNARRKLVSYPIELLVSTVRDAIRKGAIEIELTGQDTAVYGLDVYAEQALPKLLKRITEINGNYMIRIGMMNPDTLKPIIDEIIEVYRDPHIYKFIHIPLQSGSDKVLKIMRRRYTVDEYIDLVKELRRKIPGIMIATDIIVGHPGEEEDDFDQTINLIKTLEFERVHIAQYSIRPNTYSASLPQVPTRVKKKRVLRMLKVIEEVGLKTHKEFVGSIGKALVTEYNKGRFVARLYNYIPVVLMNSNATEIGEWVKVSIKNATFYDLRGIVV